MAAVKVKRPTYAQKLYTMQFAPIVLKQLMIDCDISQSQITDALTASRGKVSRATGNGTVNRGYLPMTMPGYQENIEKIISSSKKAMKWLVGRGLTINNIWDAHGEELRHAMPTGMGQRQASTRKNRALIPGDPGEYNPPQSPLTSRGDGVQTTEVRELLTGETLRHFKLFRSPFNNDIRDVPDIYMSEEHRYIEAAMIDASKHGGFLAIIGEVGSGKSVIRKKVVAELSKDDSSRIIYPRMIDKTRISAASLCDAIILDLSDESPKMRLEQKTRQVEKLLIARSKAGCHVCLMVEEAHDLSVRVLKLLKRFYEIEDGYKKAIGIILIGQPELGSLFNEQDHYDMREVIRRCQVAYIRGLNGNMKDYLALKFKRINVELKAIITDEAIKALSSRLMDKDARGKAISNAYPLTVNNYIIRAMNLACEMGEAKVTEEVIMAI